MNKKLIALAMSLLCISSLSQNAMIQPFVNGSAVNAFTDNSEVLSEGNYDNIQWSVNSDNQLVIQPKTTGKTAEIGDFFITLENSDPLSQNHFMEMVEYNSWKEYNEKITSVFIEGGTTVAEAYAFHDMPNLTLVHMADSISKKRDFYALPLTNVEWSSELYNIEDNFAVMVKGDVNADGVLNVADVILLQKWLLAVPGTELPNWKAADLCEDNKLDVFDMILMRKQLIEKMNEDIKNTYTSFKLQSVAGIRSNVDSHTEWKGYVANFEKELNDIIQESEGISSENITIEGIDKNSFNDKSVVIIYSPCSSGNRYSIIDDITIKNNVINVLTITKAPVIATPDMLYRRYIYCIDKNTAANTTDIAFNDTSDFYQYEEGNDVVKWFEEWKNNSEQTN